MNIWSKRAGRIVSGLLLGTSLLAGQGLAADLPIGIYVPPVIVEEQDQFNWDRFYAGVVGGYAWADVNITTDNPPTFFEQAFAINGPFIGITLGRNFLLGDDDEDTEEDERNILLGIEGDLAWAAMGQERTNLIDGSMVSAGINALATLRARIGVPLGEERNFLPYLTAGLAAAHAEGRLRTSPNAPVLSASDWLWGYTVGGGIEFVVDEDVTLKAEYLYTDISGRLTIDNIGAGGINTANFDFRANHLIRLGLNYHF